MRGGRFYLLVCKVVASVSRVATYLKMLSLIYVMWSLLSKVVARLKILTLSLQSGRFCLKSGRIYFLDFVLIYDG